MNDNDEVRSQILRDGSVHVVFPNAVVLEIYKHNGVAQVEGAPEWALGVFPWHGKTIPLLSIARLLGEKHTPMGHKCVVIKTLGPCEGLDCYAIHTDAFPQFLSIYRQGMLIDASNTYKTSDASMAILIGEKSVLIPDLDALESKLSNWWAKRPR